MLYGIVFYNVIRNSFCQKCIKCYKNGIMRRKNACEYGNLKERKLTPVFFDSFREFENLTLLNSMIETRHLYHGLEVDNVFVNFFQMLSHCNPSICKLIYSRGITNSLSIKPSAYNVLIISLHHCSVMPTLLAISLFCNAPFSSSVTRIFCST
jgi:hypothetical protein